MMSRYVCWTCRRLSGRHQDYHQNPRCPQCNHALDWVYNVDLVFNRSKDDHHSWKLLREAAKQRPGMRPRRRRSLLPRWEQELLARARR